MQRLSDTDLEKSLAKVVSLATKLDDRERDVSGLVAGALHVDPPPGKLTIPQFEYILRQEIERRRLLRHTGIAPQVTTRPVAHVVAPQAMHGVVLPPVQVQPAQSHGKQVDSGATQRATDTHRLSSASQAAMPNTASVAMADTRATIKPLAPGPVGPAYLNTQFPHWQVSYPRPQHASLPSSGIIHPKDKSTLARDILRSLGRPQATAPYNPLSLHRPMVEKRGRMATDSDAETSDTTAIMPSHKRLKTAVSGTNGKDELDLLSMKLPIAPIAQINSAVTIGQDHVRLGSNNVHESQSIIGIQDAYARAQQSNAQIDGSTSTPGLLPTQAPKIVPIVKSEVPKLQDSSKGREANLRVPTPPSTASTIPTAYVQATSSSSVGESAPGPSQQGNAGVSSVPLFLPSPSPERVAPMQVGPVAHPPSEEGLPSTAGLPNRRHPFQKMYVLVPKGAAWVQEWQKRDREVQLARRQTVARNSAEYLDEEIGDATVSIRGWASTRPDEGAT